MTKARDLLLAKSTLESGPASAIHLQSVVVGEIFASSNIEGAVTALEVGSEPARALPNNIEPVVVDIVEPTPVVPTLDQKLTEVILPTIETQVNVCP